MSAIQQHPSSELRQHISVITAQIVGMRAKQRRLAEAIQQRERQLARLEARAVLNGSALPALPRHG